MRDGMEKERVKEEEEENENEREVGEKASENVLFDKIKKILKN